MWSSLIGTSAMEYEIEKEGILIWESPFVYSPVQRKHAAKAAHGIGRGGKIFPTRLLIVKLQIEKSVNC